VEEFVRNFELSKYLRNAGGFFVELAHWSPPKRNVLASMPWPLDVLQGAARIVALLLSAAGAILCLTRPAGRFALALLLTFPLVHALWHYFDGRFLLLVWPVVAILTGLGAERLVVALRGLARGVAAGVLALTGLVLLLTGLSVAHQEILRWEDVTGGSARDLARRIDEIVGADAEGLYEFENVPPPVRSGPFVAMHRRARACFAFGIPDFFAPDTPPEAGPEFLREGKRFVLTNLTFAEWAARRVPDAAGRGAYQALVEERGRTLIIVKR
jgi:hypothetical protein